MEQTIEQYDKWCQDNKLSPFLKATAVKFVGDYLQAEMKYERRTCNHKIGRLGTFFTWAQDKELVTENPFNRQKIKSKKTTKSKRDDYTKAQVQQLLDTANPARDGRDWLPLISLYTGARIREVAQLTLDDIKAIDGIAVFHFHMQDVDKHPDKHVKGGENYERFTPLHSELVRRGLLDRVAQLRLAGESRLFPEFSVTKFDGKGGSASTWYRTTFRNRAGLGRTNHELRNTVITALRQEDVPETVVAELTGHEWGSTTAFRTYARASSLGKLQTAINKLPANPGRK